MSRRPINARISQAIGKVIRTHRTKAKMSQDGLGKKMGVYQCSVSYWESGKHTPSYDSLVVMADVMKVGIVEFFSDIGKQIAESSPKRA